jgi:hypothetical protein
MRRMQICLRIQCKSRIAAPRGELKLKFKTTPISGRINLVRQSLQCLRFTTFKKILINSGNFNFQAEKIVCIFQNKNYVTF